MHKEFLTKIAQVERNNKLYPIIFVFQKWTTIRNEKITT